MTKVFQKGIERRRLIGLAGAGFKHGWTTIKASVPLCGIKKDDYIKGICPLAWELKP